MKRLIVCLAVLAMAGIANATNTTNYVPDGQFESPNGDVGPWANMFGGDAIYFLSTGGNPDGCLEIIDPGAPGYGGIAYVNPAAGVPTTQPTLASLGLTAGQTYTFVMDMQLLSGTSIGGLKIESWTDTAVLGSPAAGALPGDRRSGKGSRDAEGHLAGLSRRQDSPAAHGVARQERPAGHQARVRRHRRGGEGRRRAGRVLGLRR